jgi:hypothetical protein
MGKPIMKMTMTMTMRMRMRMMVTRPYSRAGASPR